MITTIRSIRRAAALGLGGTAVAIALAACGGGGTVTADETTSAAAETTTASESATETESTEASASESATESAAPETSEAAAPVTEDDLNAAKQNWVDFYTAVGNKDYEGACRLVVLPGSKQPMTDDLVKQCAEGASSDPNVDQISPELAAQVTPELLDARDNGDGTIMVSIQGQDMPYPNIKGDDGKWYLEAQL